MIQSKKSPENVIMVPQENVLTVLQLN